MGNYYLLNLPKWSTSSKRNKKTSGFRKYSKFSTGFLTMQLVCTCSCPCLYLQSMATPDHNSLLFISFSFVEKLPTASPHEVLYFWFGHALLPPCALLWSVCQSSVLCLSISKLVGSRAEGLNPPHSLEIICG